MTTPVDICNVGLGLIGHRTRIASIDPPESSIEAEYGELFWPTVRRSVLSSHTWSCATERVTLASLAITPPTPWTYAYAMPAEALRFVGVKDPNSTDDIPYSDCRIGRQSDQTVIYTDVENAVGVYIVDVANTVLYPPMLITALEQMMASKFAGPIIKGVEGMRVSDAWEKKAMATISEAKRLDAAQTLNHDVTSPGTYKAGHLQARGVSDTTETPIVRS